MIPDQVRTLLDADAMRGLIGAIPAFTDGKARLDRISVDRVGVKPARRMIHTLYGLHLETAAGPMKSRAWACLLDEGDDGPSVYRRALRCTPRRPPPSVEPGWTLSDSTALHASPPVLLQLFPWDYRLPMLPLALDHQRIRSELGGLEVSGSAAVGYWPGVRCQLRYHRPDGLGPLYGKLFSRRGVAEQHAGVLRAVTRAVNDSAADRLATPEVFKYVPALDLLVTMPVEGRPLPELLDAGGRDDLMPRVAEALAAFHGISLPGMSRRFRPLDDLDVVRPWVALVGSIFKKLVPELVSALKALEEELPESDDEPPLLVHRDLYDAQILLGAASVAFLDLDTACLGDAEIDVANFNAHLFLRAARGQLPFDDARAAQDDLLESYRRLRPSTRMRLFDWYLASALLRLACVFAMRPRGETLAPVLLRESRRALGRTDAA